jgi:hypothetical protein
MNDEIVDRVATLERAVRWQRVALALMSVGICTVVTMPASQAQPSIDVVRTRSLIIEDTTGRARILMGAPLPSVGTGEQRTGMRINDARGFERLGLSLFDEGRMVIGLDAPPGTGDDRNRERITLVADAMGGGRITFKDRRTLIPANIYLDDANQVWLEFSDPAQNPPVRRRIGLKGEETGR